MDCQAGCRAWICRISFAYDRAAGFKKNELKPHLSKYWKIPPEGSAAFVANMEDVLEIYHIPYDPDYPVVCMDESCKQMIGEVREPIPCTPGQPARIGDEYVTLCFHGYQRRRLPRSLLSRSLAALTCVSSFQDEPVPRIRSHDTPCP